MTLNSTIPVAPEFSPAFQVFGPQTPQNLKAEKAQQKWANAHAPKRTLSVSGVAMLVFAAVAAAATAALYMKNSYAFAAVAAVGGQPVMAGIAVASAVFAVVIGLSKASSGAKKNQFAVLDARAEARKQEAVRNSIENATSEKITTHVVLGEEKAVAAAAEKQRKDAVKQAAIQRKREAEAAAQQNPPAEEENVVATVWNFFFN